LGEGVFSHKGAFEISVKLSIVLNTKEDWGISGVFLTVFLELCVFHARDKKMSPLRMAIQLVSRWEML
jgi:hypothetical protein